MHPERSIGDTLASPDLTEAMERRLRERFPFILRDLPLATIAEAMAEVASAERQREVEQAWRNGWGSALVMLRGADQLVRDASAKTMASRDRPSQRIILDMVGQWVDLIDGLTEDVIAKCREGGLASVADEEGGS